MLFSDGDGAARRPGARADPARPTPSTWWADIGVASPAPPRMAMLPSLVPAAAGGRAWMEYLRDPGPNSDLPRGGVVTIGNFDGVHRGHQVLLRARWPGPASSDVPSVVLTFDPHPEKVAAARSRRCACCRPGRSARSSSSGCGVDALVEVGFDQRFAAMPAPSVRARVPAPAAGAARGAAGRQLPLRRRAARATSTCSAVQGRELEFGVVGVRAVLDGRRAGLVDAGAARGGARARVEEAGGCSAGRSSSTARSRSASGWDAGSASRPSTSRSRTS